MLARNLAERMKVSLRQPVIIENVTGASGTIGTGRVSRARSDGYIVDLGNTITHVTNGAAYALQYDVVNDFEPVASLTTTPFLLLARKTMPAEDLNGLIAWLKSNPDKASFGTAGPGLQEIAGVLFQKRTGTRFGFVPYRGGAPIVHDLVAGQIDLTMMDPTTSLAQVRAGNVKAFAVAAARPHARQQSAHARQAKPGARHRRRSPPSPFAHKEMARPTRAPPFGGLRPVF